MDKRPIEVLFLMLKFNEWHIANADPFFCKQTTQFVLLTKTFSMLLMLLFVITGWTSRIARP